MRNTLSRKSGFTLLEVLVSATIIAVLTVIGIVSYASVTKRSRDVKRKSDMEQLRSALEMYRSDNTTSPGEYPDLGNGNSVNVSGLTATLVPSYLPAVPDDQDADLDYYYQALPAGGPYTSYCLCAYLENINLEQNANTCASMPVPSDGGECNYARKSP